MGESLPFNLIPLKARLQKGISLYGNQDQGVKEINPKFSLYYSPVAV